MTFSAGIINEDSGGTTAIETFDGSDPLANYQNVNSEFSIASSPVAAGSGALEYAPPSAADHAIFSDNHPNGTIERGSSYQVQIHDDDATNNPYQKTLFLCAAGDGSSTITYSNVDGYMVEIDRANPEMRLHRMDSGSKALSNTADMSASPSAGYYTIELRPDINSDGTIAYEVIDGDGSSLGSVSISDTTYQSGEFGFGGYRGPVYWDELVPV